MSHIFISYSRIDLDFAQKIVDALAAHDLDTWVDWKSIPKGEDWEQEIYRGIEEADAFLFLVSPDSVISEMCNKEISHAVQNSKRILPIFIANVDNKEIYRVTEKFLHKEQREEINRRNFILWRQEIDDFDEAMDETQKTIHTDYEWLKYHTRLQVKALEWERTRDNSRLLRGKELREAKEQLAKSHIEPQATELQRSYLLRSETNEELQRKRILYGLGIGLIMVSVLAIYAWIQRNNAIKQAQIAQAKQFAAQAQLEFDRNTNGPYVGTVLAIEAMRILPSVESDQLIRDGLAILPRPLKTIKLDGSVSKVAFSPDKSLVGVMQNNTVSVRKMETLEEIIKITQQNVISSITFDSDNRWMAIENSDNHDIGIWKIENGQEVIHLDGKEDSLQFEFSPDSKWFYSYVEEGNSAQIWNLETGENEYRIQQSSINKLRFSPNSHQVVMIANELSPGHVSSSVKVLDVKTWQEMITLQFEAYIYNALISPDGKWLIVEGLGVEGNGEAQVWEIATQKEFTRLKSESSAISLTFSPDGRWAMNSARFWPPGPALDHMEIWETGAWNAINSLPYAENTRFSSDGHWIVIWLSDSAVKIWELGSWQEIAVLSHDNSIYSIEFSQNGEIAMTASEDNTMRLWDVHSGVTKALLSASRTFQTSKLSIDGKTISTYSRDGLLRIWSLDGLSTEITQMQGRSRIYDVSISDNGKYLIFEGNEGNAQIWNLNTWQETSKVKHGGNISNVAISPNGRWAVTDGVIPEPLSGGVGFSYGYSTSWIWDTLTGQQISQLQLAGDVTSIYFSQDGQRVITTNRNDSISKTFLIEWDTKNWNELHREEFNDIRDNSIEVSPNLSKAVVLLPDSTVQVWNLNDWKIEAELEHDKNLSTLTFSPNNRWLTTVKSSWGGNDTLYVWDTKTWLKVSELEIDNHINNVTFNPDNRFLVAKLSSSDISWFSPNDGLYIWDTNLWRRIAVVENESIIRKVGFTPDQRYALTLEINAYDTANPEAIQCASSSLNIWKMPSWKIVKSIKHRGCVSNFSISENGKWVMTSGDDHTVRIWSIETWEEVVRLQRENHFGVASFIPESTYMIYGVDDVLLVLPWQSHDMIDVACQRLPRNLTLAEWQQLFGLNDPYKVTCDPSLYPNAVIPEDAQAYLDSE